MEKEELHMDERATVQIMKKQLHELKIYCANMRLQSILYGDEEERLQVEDEIGNYLHYSKSIVQVSKQKQYDKKDPVLQALHRQQKHQEIMQERDASAYVLLQGIAQLSEKEKELLFDVYIRQYSRDRIRAKEGGIVESTYHRRLHKAILNLAQIMNCVIYE